jgi:diguanylate cyclase (GGDEF)-like protein
MFVGQTVRPGGLSGTARADPWQFLLRLNEILTAETASIGMMQSIMEALHEVPEIEASWIAKPDEDGQVTPLAWSGAFATEHAESIKLLNVVDGPYSFGPAGRSWRSGQPEIVDDRRTDTAISIWQAVTKPLDFISVAAVPLRGRSGPHSLLVMYSNVHSFFSTVWNRDLLAHLAALIGNALENREKHAALQRAQRLYQTLFQGADQLLSVGSERRLLRQFCGTLVASGLFVSAGIGIVEDGRHRHIAAAAMRNAQSLRHASFPFKKGQGPRPLTLDAWEAGKTLIANDYFSNPVFAPSFPLARKLGFKSIAGLIIRRGAAAWAVMSVSAAETHYFDDELIQLLERMAALVGHALDELDLKAALRRERETQSQIARQDSLTELPNRLAFQERLKAAVTFSAGGCIGMIDLDDFKQINDQWGHAAGDHVLRVIGHRIRAMLRETDFIARLGGDEFALILDGLNAPTAPQAETLEAFCFQLRETVSAPLCLPNGHALTIAISAGFTAYAMNDVPPDLLVRHADMALYEAKAAKQGKSGRFWRLYRDHRLGGHEQHSSSALLRHGAVEVHFQPVLNLDEERIIALEALARLRDGATLLQPQAFLPDLTLEDRCLLFRQVLEESLAQLVALDKNGVVLNVSVNLDAQVLLLERTLPYIKDVLERTGIAPARLVLEILETHDFLDLKRAAAQFKAVRALGLRTALDDLGAGYSSILKIRELPLDVVKLDRAFVAGLREQPDDLIFISVIQTLTAAMGIKLIVEGVEDEPVLDALRMVGVRHVQGFLVAPPMEGGALAGWLRTYRPRRASKTPETLLGAYALHSNWIRAFEFWRQQEPLLTHLHRNNPYSLRAYFAGPGARHAAAREAYQALETLLRADSAAHAAIHEAAAHFRGKLVATLKTAG